MEKKKIIFKISQRQGSSQNIYPVKVLVILSSDIVFQWFLVGEAFQILIV